ncbi:hypothetical protein [Pseudomonas sp. NY11382]|uniref:hypothetical protein n=1 Tax=Pseudomonas sp. NY11382 TaxID=2939495 RepID=UPI0022DCF31D|nr:hypothetical protein [Pseudomonas sp. NY11382]WBM33651.1 hypothetical protein M2J80_04140 [Pseudomonas sp. NY11382]
MDELMSTKRKIAYAHYLQGWSYDGGNREVLKASRRVAPDEYEEEMAGSLFCPGCHTNVERTPKEKDLFTNRRDPFYRHLQRWQHVACVLRAKRPEGKRYDSWEEAKRAIDHDELTIINEFRQSKPEVELTSSGDYDETPVEDADGPLAEVPISRHKGESFKLPSKISTVAGICRNFDVNKGKYFYLPKAQHAIQLASLLTNVTELKHDILNTEQKPRLYYGRIRSSWNAGNSSTNIRMTRLECDPAIGDFTVKLQDGFCRDKGITDESVGRIVMFYGVITTNGSGLAVDRAAWGEIALVPKKYNDSLMPG